MKNPLRSGPSGSIGQFVFARLLHHPVRGLQRAHARLRLTGLPMRMALAAVGWR